jgi:hypothetical protein
VDLVRKIPLKVDIRRGIDRFSRGSGLLDRRINQRDGTRNLAARITNRLADVFDHKVNKRSLMLLQSPSKGLQQPQPFFDTKSPSPRKTAFCRAGRDIDTGFVGDWQGPGASRILRRGVANDF